MELGKKAPVSDDSPLEGPTWDLEETGSGQERESAGKNKDKSANESADVARPSHPQDDANAAEPRSRYSHYSMSAPSTAPHATQFLLPRTGERLAIVIIAAVILLRSWVLAALFKRRNHGHAEKGAQSANPPNLLLLRPPPPRPSSPPHRLRLGM
ncbi:hypothetical protein DACRYDRAFT_109918 [Dacryopinax primogenitus]|uniref:Uncharacterized protein n=1 Tax=Dacryopinax primogenitus (strain DJM 731) TaxID=1858805 RepID=M5FT68_DACPD|nr:uncharacterized protein DACRYDRAFT_109918 [Dacryopinax primogenitus]EJT99193.1 hypothetical protein DACRYDRAFT_109918 [Dacryopinax primogenitus]